MFRCALVRGASAGETVTREGVMRKWGAKNMLPVGRPDDAIAVAEKCPRSVSRGDARQDELIAKGDTQ